MNNSASAGHAKTEGPVMTESDFVILSDIIRSECGIHLTPVKKVMLTVRLVKRIKTLGLASFVQYVRYVQSRTGKDEELTHMIDAVSTNKTDFFRESGHFDYLARVAVSTVEKESARCRHQGLNVWSAGCAGGEEAYTIAMVLSEYKKQKPGFMFRVFATDISTRALTEAVRAVYPAQIAEKIPATLRRTYMLRGKGQLEGYYRVAPELRSRVVFQRHNLSDREFGFRQRMDVVFCRNVIIYLERKVQEVLFDNFHKSMSPGGYLFVGHSETLDGLTDKFARVAPTIYRRA